MGWKSTWLLIPTADEATVLGRMRLRPALPRDPPPDEQPVAQRARLPGGWTLLALDHYADSTEAFRHEPSLAAWSRGTELLGLDLNESANFSVAWGWQDSRLAWRLTHALDEGPENLTVEGSPPAGWEGLRDKALAERRAGKPGDLLFDVPVDALALSAGTTPFLLDDDTPQTPLVRDWPDVDAATREALPLTNPDDAASGERMFRDAARGDAAAQQELGLELLRLEPPTAAQGALAQRWLSLAAEQGQGAAQALLGECMVEGVLGFQRDARTGLQWLELSAAQDHPEGLARLADLLFRQSVTQRQGRTVAVDDPASRERLQRMLSLLERGVQLGYKRCLVDWALQLHDGLAAPSDLIAAKAAMRVARQVAASRVLLLDPATLALFDVSPQEREAVWALSQPGSVGLGELVQAVRARRRDAEAEEQALRARAQGAIAAAAIARAEADEALARLAQARAEEQAQRVSAAASALLGMPRASVAVPQGPTGAIVALLLGIGLFLAAVAFASQLPRGGARGLMLLAGVANGWGAWALTGTWGWRHAPRAIVAALMLVPVMEVGGTRVGRRQTTTPSMKTAATTAWRAPES